MFIVECLPLSKGLNKESLSYFSPTHLSPGALLKIAVRGREIDALVLESRDATTLKSEIKGADFQFKKLGSVGTKSFLPPAFLEAASLTGEFFAATFGSVLSHLLPAFVLENPQMLSGVKKSPAVKPDSLAPPPKNLPQTAILQAPEEERFSHYRSLVREEFAKNKSVFFCLPHNEDVGQAKRELERGIESFVYAFHRDLDKKDFKKAWREACQNPHPILVVSTARWLFLPRDDFGAIVLEKENDTAWKTVSRPFIDLRFFAEALARGKQARCILGDTFLRTESLHRYKEAEVSEFESVKWRLPTELETEVVDLRETTRKEKEFSCLSRPLLALAEHVTKKGAGMFIFAARKGLAPSTICRDCGEQVKCSNCSSMMVLYRTRSPEGEGGLFKCHQCDETRSAAETCRNCGSWKLGAYGAGIDKIAEELRKNLPHTKIFELHKDAAPTTAKAAKIAEEFYQTRGSILLGTELAFSHLSKKVLASAIASFDGLFSIPDFRIKEKIFRLVLQTKDAAREKFLIQTRNPEDQTVRHALSGNLMDFYKHEIEDRQALTYPPFGIFIKVTVRGSRAFVIRETENLKKMCAALEQEGGPKATLFGSTQEKKGEQAALNAVFKLSRADWPARLASESVAGGPASPLSNFLKSLPPHFEIKVDPDNLL